MSVIELAVSITLLGVLLALTLKGAVMIENMRALAVSYEVEQFQRFVLAYQVDHKTLPGEDPAAMSRWRRGAALNSVGTLTVSLQGNGRLDGQLYDVGNAAGEQFVAWRDLRYGGFVDGDPKLEGASAMPENPFGGFYGFDQGNLGQKEASLCATKIPGRAAQAVDKRLDDGKINTGNLVATSKFSIEAKHHFEAPDTEPYNVEKEYIICVPMLP